MTSSVIATQGPNNMTRFRVGVMDLNIVSRPTAESLTRAGYLNALANRVDSYWVPDHCQWPSRSTRWWPDKSPHPVR